MAKGNLSDRFNGSAISLRQKANRICKMSGDSVLGLIFDENLKNDTVRVQFKNNTSKTRRIALFPGCLDTPEKIKAIAGMTVDAIATEGVCFTDKDDNDKTVEVTCPNLDFIQDEMKNVPMRIAGLQLATDNEAQFFEPIEVGEFNMLRNFGSDAIKPSTYLDPSNSNKTLVLINDLKHFQLDRHHVLVVSLAPGRTLDMSMTLGAALNIGQLLDDAAHAIIGD